MFKKTWSSFIAIVVSLLGGCRSQIGYCERDADCSALGPEIFCDFHTNLCVKPSSAHDANNSGEEDAGDADPANPVVMSFDAGSDPSPDAGVAMKHWRRLPSSNVLHLYGAATLLKDGRVLLASPPSNVAGPAVAEIFDLATEKWTATGPMNENRYFYELTTLNDGRVLATGGHRASQQGYDSAELYDPSSGIWSQVSKMSVGRWQHAAAVVAGGRVLVVGGRDLAVGKDTCELFDPLTTAWSASIPLPTTHASEPPLVALKDGTALLLGGSGTAQGKQVHRFFINPPRWERVADMTSDRSFGRGAILLADGRVLVGSAANSSSPSASEIYNPATNSWEPTTPMLRPFARHRSALSEDGRVFTFMSDNGMVFTPKDSSWSDIPSSPVAGISALVTVVRGSRFLVVTEEGHTQIWE
ncbi:MAG: Kelch repeat-containing protein [Myxococcaceae bacterium]